MEQPASSEEGAVDAAKSGAGDKERHHPGHRAKEPEDRPADEGGRKAGHLLAKVMATASEPSTWKVQISLVLDKSGFTSEGESVVWKDTMVRT